MLTTKKEKVTKSQLVTSIQKSNTNSYLICDLYDTRDLKETYKELEKLVKKGSVSVIIVQ